MEALTNSSHPETSHEAAALITKTGQNKRQAILVARIVQKCPGLTSNEYAMLSTDIAARARLRHMFARRLPDAEELRIVHRSVARQDKYTHRKSITWQPGPSPFMKPCI